MRIRVLFVRVKSRTATVCANSTTILRAEAHKQKCAVYIESPIDSELQYRKKNEYGRDQQQTAHGMQIGEMIMAG